MKKAVLLSAAAALAISAGAAASEAGPPIPSTKGMNIHATRLSVPSAGLSTLYSQNNSDSSIAAISQMFGSSFPTYVSQGADDFTVPSGHKWIIKEVDVTGVYFNGTGPAQSENIYFYKNAKKNLPGKQIGTTINLKGTDNGGSFVLSLPKPGVRLKAGTYWVSVQAVQTYNGGLGEWGWENQSTSEGNKAAWQNPGNGFQTGCTKWAIENVCLPGGQGDHMFVLKGVAR